MAVGDGDTSDDEKTDPLHGKDKKSKQQRMMIIIGVVGLILTYILIRSRSSSSSGTATTGTDQALAQYEQQNASDLAGLSSQIQAIDGVVAGMYPTQGSGDGTTGTSTGTGTTAGPLQGTWAGADAGSDTTYDPVSAGQVIPNGIQLFYDVGDDVFEPYQSGVPSGTQLYITPNSSQPTGFQQGNTNPGLQTVPS